MIVFKKDHRILMLFVCLCYKPTLFQKITRLTFDRLYNFHNFHNIQNNIT